jgi:hypothetical protein
MGYEQRPTTKNLLTTALVAALTDLKETQRLLKIAETSADSGWRKLDKKTALLTETRDLLRQVTRDQSDTRPAGYENMVSVSPLLDLLEELEQELND